MILVARIADIIRRGRGTTHAWHVERDGTGPDGWETCELWHYSTRMLVWQIKRHAGSDYGYTRLVDYAIGWGSVSDQNGMNTAFRVLDLPYRFDRDSRGGGPRITELVYDHEAGYYVRELAERPELDTDDRELDERRVEALS